MAFAVRPMTVTDVPQSVQVERDAFPSISPPTAFRRELNVKIASYLTSWRINKPTVNTVTDSTKLAVEGLPQARLIGSLVSGARKAWESTPDTEDLIAGYLGIWYVADEAHIMAIGVRNKYRGEGVGELLLISGIEQALKRRTRLITLEVRESNHIAINLYKKYLFSQRGIRKRYYADNREDAIIMSTDIISMPSYIDHFQALVRDHAQRWGHSDRVLG